MVQRDEDMLVSIRKIPLVVQKVIGINKQLPHALDTWVYETSVKMHRRAESSPPVLLALSIVQNDQQERKRQGLQVAMQQTPW